MKILHTSDWHIGNFPGPEKDGKNLRFLDTVSCIKHLTSVARDNTPDVILISGDLFHQARVWADRGLSEVKAAIRYIKSLKKICPIIVMRGTPRLHHRLQPRYGADGDGGHGGTSFSAGEG